MFCTACKCRSSVICLLFFSVLRHNIQRFWLVIFCSHCIFACTAILDRKYILKYNDYLDIHRLEPTPIDEQNRLVYDLRYGDNCVTAGGAWIKHPAHWAGRGTVLPFVSEVVPMVMTFIRCAEELTFLSQLAVIMACYVDRWDKDFTTRSLNFVASLLSIGRQPLLTNLEQCLKENVFEHCLRIKLTDPLFVICHSADIFDTPRASRSDLVVDMS